MNNKENQKTITYLVLSLATIALITAFIAMNTRPASPPAYGGGLGTFGYTVTNATSSCSSVSSIIIASSSSRVRIHLSNSGTSTATICESGTCAANGGVQLYASSSNSITPNSYDEVENGYSPTLYPGAISCIMVNASVTSTISSMVIQ